MKGPPTASLIAAPDEQFSLCRTKEAERERRAEQFPGMLGTVDCLQLVPCSQVIVGNILSVVRSASIGPFSLIVSTTGLANQWRGCCRLSIRRRLLQQHEEECRCRFVQIQASRMVPQRLEKVFETACAAEGAKSLQNRWDVTVCPNIVAQIGQHIKHTWPTIASTGNGRRAA